MHELKLKELNRLIKPLDPKKDTDVSIFKYRRNIKFMER